MPASSLATHTAPAPAAIALAFTPTGIARAAFVARLRSTRWTSPSAPETTHNSPFANASERGALATSIRWSTLLEPGSTCAIVRPSPSATHNDPAPNARAAGAPPTSMVVTIWRSRSMRETVPTSRLATHTDPPPAVTAPGLWPTAYWAVMRLPSASISPTWSSPMPDRPSGSSTRMIPNARMPASTSAAAPTSAAREPPRAAAAGRGHGLGGRGQVERRVVGEDLLVQALQLGAGLDADLLDQPGARRAVGGERLRLAVAR